MGSDKKWIYLSYIAATALVGWVLNQTLILVAGMARVRNPMVMGTISASALIAFVVSVVAAWIYFRKPHVQSFSAEVAQELRKVTWPTKKTTYLSTVVVIVTCIVMAAILGVFDWICAHLISLVIRA
jgi:preprotein translocase subunit SecE